MYAPMKIDNDEYLVKPMNCPFHMMIYKSQKRSYRELPLRIAEIATVYRYEKPGELSGMLRVRHITQDDAHIFCRESQVVDEFIGVFDYMSFLLKTFGLNNYYFRLGLRSAKEKYLGNDKVWKKAEEEIVKAIEKKGLKYVKKQGEAAFYGPKLDVIIKDSIGREWQCGTIQIDFMLPERFNLEYINEKGAIEKPVLIHRAPLGSIERFLAILIEHYAGNFPIWISPVQVKILPITDRNLNYAINITQELKRRGIRTELDDRSETLGAKIRDAQLEKVAYMLIVGDKEEKNKTVNKRDRSGKDFGEQKLSEFIKNIKNEIEQKIIN
jgi:threonyl-tRNA synthetase